MKINFIITKRAKLKTTLEKKFLFKAIGHNEIDEMLEVYEEYQKENLKNIKKLKRNKNLEIRKISGALKQTINVHGPITKVLIGSASKRIYGSFLENKQKKCMFLIFKTWLKNKIK